MPTVVTLALIAVAPVTSRLVSAVTAPPIVTVVLPDNVKSNAPVNVLANVIEPVVLVKVFAIVPSVTASLNVIFPLVVMLLVFNVVLPPAFVVTLAAATVPVIVVTPVLFNVISLNAPFIPAPMLPTNVIAPLPTLILNVSAVELALSIVDDAEAKLTVLFVVVSVVLAPSVTVLL